MPARLTDEPVVHPFCDLCCTSSGAVVDLHPIPDAGAGKNTAGSFTSVLFASLATYETNVAAPHQCCVNPVLQQTVTEAEQMSSTSLRDQLCAVFFFSLHSGC